MIEVVDFEEQLRPQFEAFRDRLFSLAADSIERATLSIVHGNDKNQVVDSRSGLLLQIDKFQYLITAGHGMVEHLEAGRLPLVVMSITDKNPIILHLEDIHRTKDPLLDLAVMQLDPTTAAYLSKHYVPLRLDSVMVRGDRRQGMGMYMLAGFPAAGLEPDGAGSTVANNWKYLTRVFDGDYENVENYDSASHLIVKYERATKNFVGKAVHPPGLSGCGIWFVGDPFNKKLFMPEDFKLVGIQTAWHKGHEYAKCTWIDHALAVIWNCYPDTRGPMRLHRMAF